MARRIERRRDVFTASVVDPFSGGAAAPAVTLTMGSPFYVVLGVCSNSAASLQTVVFRNVRITSALRPAITSPD